jgi:hypothetical protein
MATWYHARQLDLARHLECAHVVFHPVHCELEYLFTWEFPWKVKDTLICAPGSRSFRPLRMDQVSVPVFWHPVAHPELAVTAAGCSQRRTPPREGPSPSRQDWDSFSYFHFATILNKAKGPFEGLCTRFALDFFRGFRIVTYLIY